MITTVRAYRVSSGRRFHRAVYASRQSAAGQVFAGAQIQARPAALDWPGLWRADRYLRVTCS